MPTYSLLMKRLIFVHYFDSGNHRTAYAIASLLVAKAAKTLKKFKTGSNMAEALKLKGENPNRPLLREIIVEDLPLFQMLATNGKSKAETK